MKTVRYILLGLIATLVIIQFINRPERINAPVTDDDIIISLQVNTDMAEFLKAACYDCHSNQPKYPWYFNFAPINWSIAEHIEHGRGEMNFSEWATFSTRKKEHKLEEMIEEVEEGHMPLASYLTMHPEARITEERLEMLKAWVNQERFKLTSLQEE